MLGQLFFLFQAEDGIRDLTVTGVQTCALPISFDIADAGDAADRGNHALKLFLIANLDRHVDHRTVDGACVFGASLQTADIRSEERRVGKECRSRWSPYH